MKATFTPGRLTKAYAQRAQPALAREARKERLAKAMDAFEDARRAQDEELDFLYSFETEAPDLTDLWTKMQAVIAADAAHDCADEYSRTVALAAERERLAQAQRVVAEAAADPVQSPGMYRRDGIIYRIQKNRDRGNLYAKKLNPVGSAEPFTYIGRVPEFLCESDRMTLAEAKAFGVETGVCCVCAALLTDPKSIAAGIGPVCAKRV